MSSAPSITVVTPAYNAAQYIRATIDSVLSQTEQDFELLIINDGSVDDTEKIVREYDSPKIVYHTNPQNLGIAKTYNRAIQLARGNYLAIAESDDISHPQRLEVQAKFLRDHPNVGAVSAHNKMFTGQPPPFDAVHKAQVELTPPQMRAETLKYGPAIRHPLAMLRADVLRDNRIAYNENLRVAFDVDLFLQLSRVTDLVILKNQLLAYRWHEKNFSGLHMQLGITEKMQTIIKFINANSTAQINPAWFEGAQIKTPELFNQFATAIETFITEKTATTNYDQTRLKKRGAQFLYTQLLGLAKTDTTLREVYNCYRRSRLLRGVNLERKWRLVVKGWG